LKALRVGSSASSEDASGLALIRSPAPTSRVWGFLALTSLTTVAMASTPPAWMERRVLRSAGSGELKGLGSRLPGRSLTGSSVTSMIWGSLWAVGTQAVRTSERAVNKPNNEALVRLCIKTSTLKIDHLRECYKQDNSLKKPIGLSSTPAITNLM